MRDSNRLNSLYLQLMQLHKKYFPDMRFCQFWLNVLGYINKTKYDPFHLEDEELLPCVKKYIESENLYFLGKDLSCYKERNKEEGDF